MRSRSLRKCLIGLMAGGLLYAHVSCLPNRDQINSMLSGSVLNGISLAITLGIEQALTGTNQLAATTTTDTTTTDTTQ
jgi:hypothetical protein